MRSFFLGLVCTAMVVLVAGTSTLFSRGIFSIKYTNFEIEAMIYMITIALVCNPFFLMAAAWRQCATFKSYYRNVDGIKIPVEEWQRKKGAYVWRRCAFTIAVSFIIMFLTSILATTSNVVPLKTMGCRVAVTIAIS
jgi:hypothetical protein